MDKIYSSSLQTSIVLVSSILCLWWDRTPWWWKHVTLTTHFILARMQWERNSRPAMFIKERPVPNNLLSPVRFCFLNIQLNISQNSAISWEPRIQHMKMCNAFHICTQTISKLLESCVYPNLSCPFFILQIHTTLWCLWV